MFKRLSSLVVIFFVVISAFFLISVSLISTSIFFNFTSDEVSKARLTLVNEAMQQVSTFITKVSDTGIYTVTNREVMEVFSNNDLGSYQAIVEQRELTRFLNDVTSFENGIHSIEIFTDHFKNYSHLVSGNIYPLEIIRNEPWFINLSNADNGWLAKHTSPTTNQSVVSYFHRLIDNAGKTKGFLKINVLPNTFFEYMSDVDIISDDADSSLMLFDSGGRVIDVLNQAKDKTILDQIVSYDINSHYQILRKHYKSFNNQYELLGSEQQYLLMISKPTKEQWRLGHVINIGYLYSDTKKIGWLVVLVGIISLLLLIPIAYYVVKKLLKPLDNLITAMKQVEKGNLQTRVDPGYIEEYRTLALNFNQMTFQLDQLLKQVKRKSREKREAEIRSLQSQIVPHFLYNTLDMIHWRALDYKAEDISFMVNQLSKMYRIAVSNGKPFILLRDEIEHAKCYIDIQSARLNQNIEYHLNVRPILKSVYVPKVILQPLIENSIKHGYPYGFNGQIIICIDIQQFENTLEISVSDNGVGFPEDWIIENSQGIGIKNIKNRINMYFGEKYDLEIEHNDIGSKVRIKLPLIKDGKALESI